MILEDCSIKHVTDKAALVLYANEETWIPLSQIEDPEQDKLVKGYAGDIEVTDWIAKQKGFTE